MYYTTNKSIKQYDEFFVALPDAQASFILIILANLNIILYAFQELDEWLRRRFRCYIWKQWKRTFTRKQALVKLGLKEWQAWEIAASRKGYWRMAGVLNVAITKEILIEA